MRVTNELAREICRELGIEWDENACEPTLFRAGEDKVLELVKIIAEFICLVLMIVNAYLAFRAKEKDDLIGMVWNLSFMILMSTCIR